MLASVGIASRRPFLLITEMLFIAAALLVIYAGWMQLRTRSRVDRVKALYERFCRKAARLGVRRNPWEGPSDFSNRAAQLLPNESKRIRQISNTYIALRYAPKPAGAALDSFTREVRAFAGTSVRNVWPPQKSEGLASLQIFFGNWIRYAFLLPKDIYDPPTVAIVKQLDGVNSAAERFRIVFVMTRFIRAPDMSDVSELFGAPGNFFFEKSVLGKIRFHACDETFYVEYLRCQTIIRSWLGGRN